MPLTHHEAVEIADRFVREREWMHGWSRKRLSTSEVADDHSGRKCWLVRCHDGGRLPPAETSVWVDMEDGTIRQWVKEQGRASPQRFRAD